MSKKGILAIISICIAVIAAIVLAVMLHSTSGKLEQTQAELAATNATLRRTETARADLGKKLTETQGALEETRSELSQTQEILQNASEATRKIAAERNALQQDKNALEREKEGLRAKLTEIESELQRIRTQSQRRRSLSADAIPVVSNQGRRPVGWRFPEYRFGRVRMQLALSPEHLAPSTHMHVHPCFGGIVGIPPQHLDGLPAVFPDQRANIRIPILLPGRRPRSNNARGFCQHFVTVGHPCNPHYTRTNRHQHNGLPLTRVSRRESMYLVHA